MPPPSSVHGVRTQKITVLITVHSHTHTHTHTHIFCTRVSGNRHVSGGARVYPKVSGLGAWRENCKWYSSLPLGAVVSLFCGSF
jgi:hypothetical protein